MGIFFVYAAVLAAFGILFFLVRGFFGKAAAFLNRKIFSSLGLPDRVLRTALIALFISNILAAAASFLYYEKDTVLRGFIRREGYGGISFTEDLVARFGEEEEEIKVEVDPRAYTEAEIEEMFARAAKALPEACLGDMPADHVDDDVRFPTALSGLPFSVTWFTDRPDVIDWDGILLDAADPKGTPVTLTAAIAFGEDIREEELRICVYPRNLTDSESRKRSPLRTVLKMRTSFFRIPLTGRARSGRGPAETEVCRCSLRASFCRSSLFFPGSGTGKRTQRRKKRNCFWTTRIS